MRRQSWAVTCVAVLIGAYDADVNREKPTKPAQRGTVAADAVFRDAAGDRMDSDGYVTTLCDNDSNSATEPSRCCGANDPIYTGLGPECSRIRYDLPSGDYVFRALSSSCSTYPPPATRKAVLDLSDSVNVARCENTNPADNLIARSVEDPDTHQVITRYLDVCGSNVIDDLRLEAAGMFGSGNSSIVMVSLSLHAPPLANTTQFVLEYQAPIPVTGTGSRRLEATIQSAVLWEMVVGKGGKLVKAATPVGEYLVPFCARGNCCALGRSLKTARAVSYDHLPVAARLDRGE